MKHQQQIWCVQQQEKLQVQQQLQRNSSFAN